MADTTFEQARRCPICEFPGRDESFRPGPRNSKLHVIRCMNERCRWYNTTYIVQVNFDGTVSEPATDRQKFFPKIPERDNAAMEAAYTKFYNETVGLDNEVK